GRGRGRGRGRCGHNQSDKNIAFWILFGRRQIDPGDFPSGTGAVMLRTEPAALSLPGPSGSGFPSQAVAGAACSIRKRMRRQVAPFLRSMHPVSGCKGQRC
ncbi:hypothetical protein, partial [Citrobacter sp. wls715]